MTNQELRLAKRLGQKHLRKARRSGDKSRVKQIALYLLDIDRQLGNIG